MDEHPPLTIRDCVPGHRFEAAVDGRTAVLTYQVRTDGSMLFVHTVVPQMLRGQGIHRALCHGGGRELVTDANVDELIQLAIAHGDATNEFLLREWRSSLLHGSLQQGMNGTSSSWRIPMARGIRGSIAI